MYIFPLLPRWPRWRIELGTHFPFPPSPTRHPPTFSSNTRLNLGEQAIKQVFRGVLKFWREPQLVQGTFRVLFLAHESVAISWGHSQLSFIGFVPCDRSLVLFHSLVFYPRFLSLVLYPRFLSWVHYITSVVMILGSFKGIEFGCQGSIFVLKSTPLLLREAIQIYPPKVITSHQNWLSFYWQG